MLLKLSVRSAGSEFKIVGAAWQNAWLPKTVLAGPSIENQTMVAGVEMIVVTFAIEAGRRGRLVDVY